MPRPFDTARDDPRQCLKMDTTPSASRGPRRFCARKFRRRGDAVARARPHRPAGARERDAAQRRAGGRGAADYQRLRRGLAAPLYLIQNEVDQIFQNLTRDAAIAEARRIAEQRAVSGGADGATLQVVEVEDLPLAYLPGNSLGVRVRVVGDIGDRGGASTPTASSSRLLEAILIRGLFPFQSITCARRQKPTTTARRSITGPNIVSCERQRIAGPSVFLQTAFPTFTRHQRFRPFTVQRGVRRPVMMPP